MGGWNDKELGRQYERKSSEHAQEMARRIAAELRVARLEAGLRLCVADCIDPTEGEVALTRARQLLSESNQDDAEATKV